MKFRHLRRMVGILFAAVIAWFVWTLARVHRTPTKVATIDQPVTGVIPKQGDAETGSFDGFVLDWAGDHIESGHFVRQPDGSSLLTGGVLVRMKNEAGQDDVTIHADRGVLPAVEGEPIELLGMVRVETPTPPPLTVDGQELEIIKASKLVCSSKPVHFEQGDVSGDAGQLEHEWENRVTRLDDSPVVKIKGNRTNGRVVTLSAQHIERREASHAVRLVDEGSIDFGDGRIEGKDVDVTLSDDGQQVRRIDARGSARTTTRLTAEGQPTMERILEAEHVVHDFLPGNRLQVVDAEGGAALHGQSVGGGGATESLVGDAIHLMFSDTAQPALSTVLASGAPARFERHDEIGQRSASGGSLQVDVSPSGHVEKLVAKENARLEDIPVERASKLLEARNATLTFTPGGDVIQDLDFDGSPAHLTESRVTPVSTRKVVARMGHLVLDGQGLPIGGSLEGEVLLEEPGSKAKADRADFKGPPRVTTLTGHASVEQHGKTSHGDTIVRDEGTGTLTVTGTQHTVVRDVGGLPGMEAEQASNEPVYISSEKLVLDEATEHATYSGGRPSLRRGDTELVADNLVIDDASGELDATGAVQSHLRLRQPGQSQPEPGALFDPTKVVDGKSDGLHYARKDSIVTYAGNVELKQESAVLTADHVDIGLENGTSRVRSLDATGSALFQSPDREAEGQLIHYQASDGSVRVEGGRRPARARDAKGQFVKGGVVEFAPDGAVRVLSPAAGRTEGSAPAAPPPAGT